jgi:tRNA dimethylallyltransferase
MYKHTAWQMKETENRASIRTFMSTRIPIICVIGPTGSGKSARAIELAKKIGGEVISVDSRQVYKTLDIGTEKINLAEMKGVPHHLIDIREPEDSYSAGDFVKDASRLIEVIHSKGKTPILAGGSHFYFDALLNGLPCQLDKNEEFRKTLELKTNEELLEEIKKRDERRASEVDPNNRRRLVRALEIIEARGVVPKREIHNKYDVTWVTLEVSREELRAKIAKRLQETLARGLVEEVRRTRERVGDERLNELGLEYRIVGEFIRGERTEDSLLPALQAKLFQYARRQEAWIRKLTKD